MHSATPQEDFVCGFGVREGGRREGGANRVKRMPHAMQARCHDDDDDDDDDRAA